MKKFIVILYILGISLNLFSQDIKIAGKITDDSNNAIFSATVVVLNLDSSIISATDTKENGEFSLNARLKTKQAIVQISHISYETKTFKISKDTVLNVVLQEKSYLTDDITVKAKRPMLEFKDGNMVANVESLPNSETADVSEILKTLPGVIANERDGLKLNGKTATIYIDGKKQKLPGGNIYKLLESLPATSIDQVELVTVAGGKYDAASSGAVINLKTKKQKLDGYFLSVGAGSSWRVKNNNFDAGGNIFYMFKNENIFFNTTLSFRNLHKLSISDKSTLYQDKSEMYNRSEGLNTENLPVGSINLIWNVKNGHTLSFNVFSWNSVYNYDGNQSIKVRNSSDDKDYILDEEERGYDDMQSGTIEYSTPDSLNGKFTASYGIIFGGIRGKEDYFTRQNEKSKRKWYLYTQPEMFGYMHTGKVDYTRKFKKIGLKLETGLKADLGKVNDNVEYRQANTNAKLQASDFTGTENVYAAYATLLYDINNNLKIRSSLRMEYTDYDMNLKSENTQSTDKYSNFFPYFHLYYNVSKNYQTVLAFFSGIFRPNYEHLLPGIRYHNDFFRTVGNPDIKPTLTKTIAWVHYFFGYGYLDIRYRFSKDVEGLILKGSENNIREYTFMNYADRNLFKVIGTIPFQFFNKKLSGKLEPYLTYSQYKNAKNSFVLPESRNDFWRFNLTFMAYYEITKHLQINTWLGYNPAYKELQYDYKTNWSMDLGISYKMLKNNRLTIALQAEDIFDTYRKKHIYYYAGNELNQYQRWGTRFIQLKINFKLRGGQKIENKTSELKNNISRFKSD